VPRLQGAFSTVVMTGEAVVAFRDPYGLRPLALGVIESGDRVSYCVASESCAFDLIGATFLREVQPGHWSACHFAENFNKAPTTEPRLDHHREVTPAVLDAATIDANQAVMEEMNR